MNLKQLKATIKLLKKSRLSDQEFHEIIATIVKMHNGGVVITSKLVPEGKVIIGTGNSFPILSKEPKITQ